MQCDICFDTITKSVADRFACLHCDGHFCRECCARYILEAVNPKCPGCFREWTRYQLLNSFGRKFMKKDYKEKRERDVYELEKALFPLTQLRMVDKKRDAEDARLNPFRKLIGKAMDKLMRAEDWLTRRENCPLKHEYIAATQACLTILTKLPQKREETAKNPTVTFKCFKGECRGFVTKADKVMACGLCETVVCERCREEKRPKHKCDENLVETVALLLKDTKPCPKCSVSDLQN